MRLWLNAALRIVEIGGILATGGWSLADFSQDFDGWFAGAGLEIL